jgi:hypothetical protein
VRGVAGGDGTRLVEIAPLAPTLDLQHQGGDVVPEFSAGVVTIIAKKRCPKASPFVRVLTQSSMTVNASS